MSIVRRAGLDGEQRKGKRSAILWSEFGFDTMTQDCVPNTKIPAAWMAGLLLPTSVLRKRPASAGVCF